MQFALAFAVNSLAFIIAATLSARLVRFVDPELLLAAGAGLVLLAGVLCWGIDTHFPSVAGFIGTWWLFAFGIAFAAPGAFAALLHSARAVPGLPARPLCATQMLSRAVSVPLAVPA